MPQDEESIEVGQARTGRRPEVSDQQIIEAGQRIRAAGRPVTGFSLRLAIGKGSQGRLMSVWEAWASQQEATVPANDAADTVEPAVLPPGLAEAWDSARGQMVSQLDGLVFATVRRIETDLKARYKADFDRLTSERAAMEEQLQAAAKALEIADLDNQAAQAEISELESKLNTTREQLAAAQQRADSVEAQAARDRAEAQAAIEALEGQIETFAAAAQAAQTSAAVATARAEAGEADAGRLRDDLATTRATLAQTTEAVATARAEAAGLAARLEAQTDRAARAEQDAAEIRTKAQEEAENLRGQLAAAREGLAASQAQVIALQAAQTAGVKPAEVRDASPQA